jgi:CubicO group peptidase (beta-lactamase class C family)
MKRWLAAVSVVAMVAMRAEAGAETLVPAMKAHIDQGVIPGAVMLVADRDHVLALEAVGEADLASHAPMRTNSVFWIASMTKPTTGALILMLQDEGKLSVDDPVAKHLPEFKGIRVKGATADATLTIRRLLTHTSGLETVPPAKPDAALAELAASYAAKPLKFEPGSKWEYCNGGINTLGRIVEVVSGKPYAQFLRERLLEPLGMTETTFWPSGDLKSRLATSYTVGTDGRLEPTDIFFLKGALDDTTRTAFPSGGLFSTAADYARFLQMLLNGGEWKGRRLLSREAAAQMTRTQTGDLKTGFVDGMSFGFACGVVRTPRGVTAMLSPGTFGHGGAYGTQAWADPAKGRVFILMIQRAKLANGDNSDMRRTFQDAAVRAYP